MAIHTKVSNSEFIVWLGQFSVGSLETFYPIQQGIENSIYGIVTVQQAKQYQWVCVLFEDKPVVDLLSMLDLMVELKQRGFPVAEPQQDIKQRLYSNLVGKLSVLFPLLPGRHLQQVSKSQLQQIAQYVAQLHLSQEIQIYNSKLTGLALIEQLWCHCCHFLPQSQYHLLAKEISELQQVWPQVQRLPKGLIHGDLFRDNVLFSDSQLTGILDFDYATVDCLLFDVAVLVVDWCVDQNHSINFSYAKTVFETYRLARPFTKEEQQAWPWVLQWVALRFCLSRWYAMVNYCEDFQLHREKIKDPMVFARILNSCKLHYPKLLL